MESNRPCRAPRAARLAPRPGISLLEVLISMFVLLFGLMGVASVFPVGNHYAGRGDQFERGAALADAAFAQLKSRGLLQPEKWLYGGRPYGVNPQRMPAPYYMMNNGAFAMPLPTMAKPDEAHPGHAIVIDPMGIAAAWGQNEADAFPRLQVSRTAGDPQVMVANSQMSPAWEGLMQQRGIVPGGNWPLRRVSLPAPNAGVPAGISGMAPRTARQYFTLHDDLAAEQPQQDDRPGVQRWTVNNNGTSENPFDDIPLSRSFSGNYSWLATIVPTTGDNNLNGASDGLEALQPAHPMYGSELYEVSVAVFYKREFDVPGEGEQMLSAQLNPGGELLLSYQGTNDSVLNSEYVDAALEGIRPGQWIAIAGVHPTSGRFLLKWYRLLSVDDESKLNDELAVSPGFVTTSSSVAYRMATVDGPEWPRDPAKASGYPVENLRVLLLPGVIGVRTQYLPME